MDWDRAIERNREPLLRIIAALFAMIGMTEAGQVARLSRPVYRAVLLVLRPAEAAVRRLIIVAAHRMVVKPSPVRSAPVGLAQRLDHRPAELSGGEQQRVAIARALANKPLLLLADEPTGNLDPKTAEHVHAEFLRLIFEEGLGALVATHNVELARQMSRVLKLEHGRLLDVQ